MGKPIPGWSAGQDVCFAFDDKTGAHRSDIEMQEFIDELRVIANKRGFDLSQWGTRSSFAKFFHAAFNPDGTYRDAP